MSQSGTGFKSTSQRNFLKKKKIEEYSCIQKDETAIKAGSSELIWLMGCLSNQSIKKSFNRYIKRTKHVCSSRTISVSGCKQVWNTFCFHQRWRYLVSTSM